MSDRPRKFDGEDRQTDALAPENENDEQEDEGEQAQTVAEEALTRGTDFGLEDSEKVSTGDDSDDAQDLVDRMEQMASSGHIDMDAYAGEPNDDDEDEKYGVRRRRRGDPEDDDEDE